MAMSDSDIWNAVVEMLEKPKRKKTDASRKKQVKKTAAKKKKSSCDFC